MQTVCRVATTWGDSEFFNAKPLRYFEVAFLALKNIYPGEKNSAESSFGCQRKSLMRQVGQILGVFDDGPSRMADDNWTSIMIQAKMKIERSSFT